MSNLKIYFASENNICKIKPDYQLNHERTKPKHTRFKLKPYIIPAPRKNITDAVRKNFHPVK